MSRRAPNPAAERAAQNQATIKSLLKLEANKTCADCKRNKHPRWASWSLGVFLCIRCSGVHRGMGTHISKVKSVDLDSWNDEQLQSILSWGNSRANKYWEAKLAPGHTPSEAKIEKFIRTKYELKRWVMDGPKPDPATLDVEGDDDVPLSLVKEKQVIERKESVRKASAGQTRANHRVAAPEGDLIGPDGGNPSRTSSAGPSIGKVAPKAQPAQPKTTSTKDSLLGLDLLGAPTTPRRPSSMPTSSLANGPSRPDLKQSILSLYATAPKPQPPPAQATQPQGAGVGSVGSPPQGHQRQTSFGGLSGSFNNLTMSNPAVPKNPPTDPFAGLGSTPATNMAPAATPGSSTFGGLSGGSFFDAKPAHAPAPVQKPRSMAPSHEAFSSLPATGPTQPTSLAMGDLFDLTLPATETQPAAPVPAAAPASTTSVFNLTVPQAASPAAAVPSPRTTSLGAFAGSGLSGADAWGGNAWDAAAPSESTTTSGHAAGSRVTDPPKSTLGGTEWGSSAAPFASMPIVPGAGGGFNPAPKVAADEEFGGWTSTGGGSMGAGSVGVGVPKASSGLGGDDDLFSNVWQ